MVSEARSAYDREVQSHLQFLQLSELRRNVMEMWMRNIFPQFFMTFKALKSWHIAQVVREVVC